MNSSKKIVMAIGLVLLVLVIAVGCGGGGTPKEGDTSQEPVMQERIVRSTEATVPVIDPGVGSDYASSIAFANLYDTLVFPNHDGTLSPWLATHWEADDGGLVWTFYLREGVKFHNGDELTAEDVVFSMNRMLTIGEGYGYLFSGVVKKAEALDTYTVRFTLDKPFGPFLSTLVRLYILNASEVMANLGDGPYGDMGDYGKNWLITNDAGSGPYMVKELKMQEYLHGAAFKDYWAGWEADAPEAFMILGTTSGQTVRTLINRRELEITDQWQTKEALDALEKIPGVAVNSVFSGTNLNIMLNTKVPPTDDVHFRRALSYVFDYDVVVDQLFPDSAKSRGPVPANLPGHNPNIPEQARNLAKAQEELAKSKYADRLNDYPMELVWIAEVPDEEKVAMLLQSNAAEIGIKVDVVRMPWLSFVDLVTTMENTPNASIVFVSSHYNEAGSILESRYHSRSTGTWEQGEWLMDPEIDKAIDEAIGTVDFNERMQKYMGIQEKIVELAPTLWVFDQAEKRAYQEDYIFWPAAELTKAGKPVTSVMGYQFYYRDFKVYPDRIPK